MIHNVSVNPQANVYFDGKCVSHSITLADGSKKSAVSYTHLRAHETG
jgi:uncharacterized protein YaiE (UPF0345 family)